MQAHFTSLNGKFVDRTESETPESSSFVCLFYIKKELTQKGKKIYSDATLLKSLQCVLGPGGTTWLWASWGRHQALYLVHVRYHYLLPLIKFFVPGTRFMAFNSHSSPIRWVSVQRASKWQNQPVREWRQRKEEKKMVSVLGALAWCHLFLTGFSP